MRHVNAGKARPATQRVGVGVSMQAVIGDFYTLYALFTCLALYGYLSDIQESH
jgi:hypothetical protein